MALLFFLLAGVLAAPAAARIPRDPSWPYDWAQQRVRLPEVWDHTTGRPEVVIAAIDTGVNTALADLQGALVPGWDFTDNDDRIEDEHGHGTLVASQMVARGDNATDIAGYCWQCRVMPVRVTRQAPADNAMIAQGIRWAVDNGARIMTIGFVQETGPPPDDTVGAAIAYAVSRGVLVVVSAGNTGDDRHTYPGAYPGVLVVAGTDENDKLYEWSTRGSWVPLAAPGCQAVISRLGPWGHLCGTSFTGPAVAAIAALAVSLKPEVTAEQVKRALIETAVPVAGIGAGRVDAYAALQRLGAVPARPVQPPPPPPPPRPQSNVARRTLTGTLRSHLRVAITIGAGPLIVRLRLSDARGCDLSVEFGGEVLMPTSRRANTIGLAARLPAGRYVIDAACRTPRVRRYVLSIVAAKPLKTVTRRSR